jgi:hypothetical protein
MTNNWRDEPATPKQLRALKAAAYRQGCSFEQPTNKGHAHDQLKALNTININRMGRQALNRALQGAHQHNTH